MISKKTIICSGMLALAGASSPSMAGAIIVAKSGGSYTTIQAGLSAANAGDTVFVKAETYAGTVTFGKSGTPNAPIVLMNFGADVPVIDGNGVSGNVVTITDKSYVQIIGFEVINASGGDPSIGISIEGSGTGVLVKNCKVHNIASDSKNAHGIAAYGTSGTTPIRRLVLDGNEVYNCKLGQSESVALNGNVDSFTVTNNIVHDNDNIGIDFIGFEGNASANDQARNGICAGNHVYNISSKTNPTYGGEQSADGIYVDGGAGIVIERNTIDKCDIGVEVASEHGGRTTSDILVRNNFISRSYQGNLMTGGYASSKGNASNIVIANNTTYQGNDGEVLLQFNNSGVTVSNNILFAKSGVAYVMQSGSNNSNITVDNNMYFGASASSPGAWTDARAKFADPMLSGAPSNMHLTENSPAINAGIALTDSQSGTHDIDEQDRIVGGMIDIGADEFTPGTALIRKERAPAAPWKVKRGAASTSGANYSLERPASVSYTLFGIDGRVLSSSVPVRRTSVAHIFKTNKRPYRKAPFRASAAMY